MTLKTHGATLTEVMREVPADEKINFKVQVPTTDNDVTVDFGTVDDSTTCMMYNIKETFVEMTNGVTFNLALGLQPRVLISFWIDWREGIFKMGQGDALMGSAEYNANCEIGLVMVSSSTMDTALWEIYWNEQGMLQP